MLKFCTFSIRPLRSSFSVKTDMRIECCETIPLRANGSRDSVISQRIHKKHRSECCRFSSRSFSGWRELFDEQIGVGKHRWTTYSFKNNLFTWSRPAGTNLRIVFGSLRGCSIAMYYQPCHRSEKLKQQSDRAVALLTTFQRFGVFFFQFCFSRASKFLQQVLLLQVEIFVLKASNPDSVVLRTWMIQHNYLLFQH